MEVFDRVGISLVVRREIKGRFEKVKKSRQKEDKEMGAN